MISHLTDKTSLSRLLPPICPQLRSSKLADPKTCSKVEHSEAEDIRHKNAETSDTCNNQFLHSTDEPNEKASMEMNNFEKVSRLSHSPMAPGILLHYSSLYLLF